MTEDEKLAAKFAGHSLAWVIAEYALPPKEDVLKALRATDDLEMFQFLWKFGGRRTPVEIQDIVWTMTSVRQFQWLCQIGSTTERKAHMTKIVTWSILHDDVEAFRWIRTQPQRHLELAATFSSGILWIESEARPGFFERWQKEHPGKFKFLNSTDPIGSKILQIDVQSTEQILLRLSMDMRRVILFEWPLTEGDIKDIICHRHVCRGCLPVDECSACKAMSNTVESIPHYLADAKRWIEEVRQLGPLPGGTVRIVADTRRKG
jgi:hypothetical protein